jgi:hypothetical protein
MPTPSRAVTARCHDQAAIASACKGRHSALHLSPILQTDRVHALGKASESVLDHKKYTQ